MDIIDFLFTTTPLGAIVAVVFSLIYGVISGYVKERKRAKDDISLKLKFVSHSIGMTSAELFEIQDMLQKRIKYVDELSERARQAEAIVSLNSMQINSINKILKEDSQKSFWQGVRANMLIGFIFFILGALANYYI